MLDVHLHHKLASGAHGSVVEGVCGSRRLAVKVLPLSDRQTHSEIAAFAALGRDSHDNVVTALAPHVAPDKAHVYLPMEMCDGDLLSHTDAQDGLEEWQASPLFLDVVRGLRFLHTKGVFHLDLKPENILMRAGVPKIADLGTAVVGKRGQRTRRQCGTPIYACPEAVAAASCRPSHARTPSNGSSAASSAACSRTSSVTVAPEAEVVFDDGFDPEKADVWSLGVTLFVLVTGYFPWKLASGEDKRYNAWRASYYEPSDGRGTPVGERVWRRIYGKIQTQKGTALSTDFIDLIRRLLHPDPEKRPSLKAVEGHAYFRAAARR